MPDERDDLELVFSTEPIIGWRVWRVLRAIDRKLSALELARELLESERQGETRPVARLFRYRLRSLTQPVFWPPGEAIVSNCGNADGDDRLLHSDGPQARCACGIWALDSRSLADEVCRSYAASATSLAVGRIALWGRIVEHEKGWRGQYAYPLDLLVIRGTSEIVRDLAEDYAVPVSLARATDADEPPHRRRAA